MYEVRVVEQSDDRGAANFFIRAAKVSKFFDEQSRRKFHVLVTDAVLLVDSGENEYGVDVYFWANDQYQHEPVDY
jgi:hypothetical protein